jgi:hypothetical protein
MADTPATPPSDSANTPPSLFTEPTPPRSFPTTAVVIAAVAVTVLVVVLVLMGHKPTAPPTTLQPVAAYADNLEVSNIEMSQSSSIVGGKLTYIDGQIANKGTATVTGVTVQVIFANDVAMPAQIETVPLTLIRTRVPYVDIEPVSAAPIPPGGEADFRLILESVPDNWNTQTPGMRAIQVSLKQ